ncbi:hypothetical protein MKW98_002711 [Papaver atlanticum]|uniref:Uncharacterized protein n=1 Tax=Papaver atlanticum TaxID=357466 RepID=A0AAD4XCL3_9MAGN|nr:hypothetical protein MKW98_002711 [Papaver atlanticum]
MLRCLNAGTSQVTGRQIKVSSTTTTTQLPPWSSNWCLVYSNVDSLYLAGDLGMKRSSYPTSEPLESSVKAQNITKEFLQKIRPQDVLWLYLLPEKELDVLLLLKSLVIERATYVGHEHIAKKFDLKMLRKLHCHLMDGDTNKLSSELVNTEFFIDQNEDLEGGQIEDNDKTQASLILRLSKMGKNTLRRINNLLEEVSAPINVKSRKKKNSSRTRNNDVSLMHSLKFGL